MLDLSFEATQKRDFRSASAVKKLKFDEPADWGRVPPKEYKRTYGSLVSMKSDRSLTTAFGNGSSAHSTPLLSRKSVELLPGVYSFDEPVLNFQRELAKS